LGLAH